MQWMARPLLGLEVGWNRSFSAPENDALVLCGDTFLIGHDEYFFASADFLEQVGLELPAGVRRNRRIDRSRAKSYLAHRIPVYQLIYGEDARKRNDHAGLSVRVM
ncbi:MAG TPA: hypothetical protein PLB02_05650 [Thermoanaerobaculia bacterium]|nr:hypothetical protein [Thermoanaerobaculia bacterium]